MLKNNALKTSLMFLGIIVIALIVRMFTHEDSLLVRPDTSVQVAGVNCATTQEC